MRILRRWNKHETLAWSLELLYHPKPWHTTNPRIDNNISMIDSFRIYRKIPFRWCSRISFFFAMTPPHPSIDRWTISRYSFSPFKFTVLYVQHSKIGAYNQRRTCLGCLAAHSFISDPSNNIKNGQIILHSTLCAYHQFQRSEKIRILFQWYHLAWTNA